MGFIDRITKKCFKTASSTVTESVKTEIKQATVNAIPAIIGIGTVVLSVLLFKSPEAASTVAKIPTVSNMTVVTNNYFFDEATKADILSKLLTQK
jgi:hypothetical protein